MQVDPINESQSLTPEDLLAGSKAVHEIEVPLAVLTPNTAVPNNQSAAQVRTVRLRPLSIAALSLISRAARNEPSLVPLLTIKEALVEPVLSLEQVKQLHIGLVHYLVCQINRISGLTTDGEALAGTLESPIGDTHLLLAKHFGWTPEQVSQLTPGQVAVYLAGIDKLLELEKAKK